MKLNGQNELGPALLQRGNHVKSLRNEVSENKFVKLFIIQRHQGHSIWNRSKSEKCRKLKSNLSHGIGPETMHLIPMGHRNIESPTGVPLNFLRIADHRTGEALPT